MSFNCYFFYQSHLISVILSLPIKLSEEKGTSNFKKKNVNRVKPSERSLLFFSWIPESPRWLLIKGEEEKAKEVLVNVAKMNKRTFPDDLVLQKPIVAENRGSFCQLFSGWKTAKKTLICWDLWYSMFMNTLKFTRTIAFSFFCYLRPLNDEFI